MLSHSALTPVHVVLHKVQKRIAIVFGILGDWAAFIGAVLILGLGTSWYMIDVGTPLTTVRQGPWLGWVSGGRADADPYTRAHFTRLGTLQLSAENLRGKLGEPLFQLPGFRTYHRLLPAAPWIRQFIR